MRTADSWRGALFGSLILVTCVFASSAIGACLKIVDMISIGYTGGHKLNFCKAKHFNGLVTLYRNHGKGGFCANGGNVDPVSGFVGDCKLFSIHALTANKKEWTAQDDENYMATVGECTAKVHAGGVLEYSKGHKHNFCASRGFDSVYNTPGGPWCYSGSEEACKNLKVGGAPAPSPQRSAAYNLTFRYQCVAVADKSKDLGDCNVTTSGKSCAEANTKQDQRIQSARGDICQSCTDDIFDPTTTWNGQRTNISDFPCASLK
jgi:hypothetical protein